MLRSHGREEAVSSLAKAKPKVNRNCLFIIQAILDKLLDSIEYKK